MSALIGLVTLTFDLLTLKRVCESHRRWGTFVLNLDRLGLRVLQLFAMYATDRRTDGQNQRLLPPFPTGEGIKTRSKKASAMRSLTSRDAASPTVATYAIVLEILLTQRNKHTPAKILATSYIWRSILQDISPESLLVSGQAHRQTDVENNTSIRYRSG